jgi:hypothetical protein
MMLNKGHIYLLRGNRAQFVKYYSESQRIAKFVLLEGFDPTRNITNGGMVSCRLRGTFISNYTELQAGGNASKLYKHGN